MTAARKPTAPATASPFLSMAGVLAQPGRKPIGCFDPGWRTGWALRDGTTGTIDLSRFKGDDVDEAEALIEFSRQVERLLFRMRAVVIERPMGEFAMTEWPNTLSRLIHMQAHRMRLPRREIRSNDWRKALVGRPFRVTDKEVRHATVRLGYRPANEHEADAAGTLSGWIALNRGEAGL